MVARVGVRLVEIAQQLRGDLAGDLDLEVLTGRGFQVERVPAGIVAGDVTGDGVHEREMHDVTPSLVDRREHPIPG